MKHNPLCTCQKNDIPVTLAIIIIYYLFLLFSIYAFRALKKKQNCIIDKDLDFKFLLLFR